MWIDPDGIGRETVLTRERRLRNAWTSYVLPGLLAIVLVAVAPVAEAAPVTIEVWYHSGQEAERAVMNALVREFNAMQNDVRVNAIELPEASYSDQVNAAAMAGRLPDLLEIDGPFMANYVWSGYIQPLDRFISAELRADLLPSIIAQGTYPPDGKIYALGVFDSGLGIWANKAYLRAAGVRIPRGLQDAWTRQEFEEVLAKLQALPEVKHALDLKLNYGRGEWFTYGFSPILQSMGADLINRKTWRATGTLNSPAAVEALTMMQNWVKKGYIVPADAGDASFYGDKTAALAWVGHWMWGPHSSGLGDDLVLLPMPRFGERSVTGLGSWAWSIPTKSRHPEAAWKFLEYLLQPDQMLRMTDANGAVPSRKSALARSKLYGPRGPLAVLAEQLNTIAVARPTHPAYPVITSAFAEAVDNILAGADVKAQLDRAARRIDEEIEENLGYPPFSQ